MKRDDELLSSYLDGLMTDQEVIEFEEWLRSDPANVRQFVVAVARDEQLRKTVIALKDRTAGTVATAAQVRSNRGTGTARSVFKWLTIASLIVAVSWFLLPSENSASVVTFDGGSGPVYLQDAGGIESGLSLGESFATGTLKVGGEGTRANFSYSDGSRVTVAGGTRLTFENGNGKRLELDRGTLAARISPQTRSRPLIIITPTAEAVMRETSLIIDADQDSALFLVNGGEVQLRRLADNQKLTIAQNEQAVAEKDPKQPLQSEKVKQVPTDWEASADAEGNIVWFGEWTQDNVLKAKGRRIYRKDIKTNETHYHAGAHDDFPGLVTLQKNSAIRIRYRINKPINVGLFLSTHLTSWNFAGNFQHYIEERKTPPDADGWRVATIPISSFHPLHQNGMEFQSGSVVATIFATTYGDDAGLEVAELSVTTIEK